METLTKTLSTEERERLAAHEKTISAGLQTFRDVGAALLDVRDSRLWRESFASFESYCREKWGIGSRRAHQLCEAVETVNVIADQVNNCSLPEKESHVRPLTKLPMEDRAAAWQLANEQARKESRGVTAGDVQEVVTTLTGASEQSQPVNESNPVRPPVTLKDFEAAGVDPEKVLPNPATFKPELLCWTRHRLECDIPGLLLLKSALKAAEVEVDIAIRKQTQAAA